MLAMQLVQMYCSVCHVSCQWELLALGGHIQHLRTAACVNVRTVQTEGTENFLTESTFLQYILGNRLVRISCCGVKE